MASTSVWAKPPRHVISDPSSRPLSSKVRHTWAGPFDPQLYSDPLIHLSKTTEQNISRLERMKQRPQTAYVRTRTASVDSSWHDSSVMFAPRSTLDGSVINDDASSVYSVSARASINFCYLCSTLEEHQKHMMRMRVPRKPKEPAKPRIRYIAPLPKVRQKMIEEPQEVYDSRYKVVVWTGNEPGATTDANVYITIKGKRNVLHKTRLCRGNSNKKFCFCQGSKETFYIKSPFLGELQILSVEHDGLEKRHSWYCEKIEVTCLRTHRHWVFHCKNWLSLHHGDYMIMRDLTADYIERKEQEFELTVTTGKKRLAGTDANVYVTFRGAEGSSPRIKLGSGDTGKVFQRNSVDRFHVKFLDIGEIQSMRIEHDGTGIASGWFLDQAVMQNMKDPKVIYYFLLNGWLARDVGDGHLWREIRAKRKLAKEVTTGKPVNYTVTVRTGDVKYAGTDANVYVIIQGKKGKTKKLFMDDAKDNFERGAVETFELTAMNTGPIMRINIGHDNSGPGAGWYCEDVVIKKYLTKEEIVQFLNNLKKERKPKDKRKKRLSEKLKKKSDMKEEDEEDESEDDSEEDEEEIKFGSYRDVFDIDGKVVKVPEYEEYTFVCKNWLAKDEADGLLERELEVKKKTVIFKDRD